MEPRECLSLLQRGAGATSETSTACDTAVEFLRDYLSRNADQSIASDADTLGHVMLELHKRRATSNSYVTMWTQFYLTFIKNNHSNLSDYVATSFLEALLLYISPFVTKRPTAETLPTLSFFCQRVSATLAHFCNRLPSHAVEAAFGSLAYHRGALAIMHSIGASPPSTQPHPHSRAPNAEGSSGSIPGGTAGVLTSGKPDHYFLKSLYHPSGISHLTRFHTAAMSLCSPNAESPILRSCQLKDAGVDTAEDIAVGGATIMLGLALSACAELQAMAADSSDHSLASQPQSIATHQPPLSNDSQAIACVDIFLEASATLCHRYCNILPDAIFSALLSSGASAIATYRTKPRKGLPSVKNETDGGDKLEAYLLHCSIADSSSRGMRERLARTLLCALPVVSSAAREESLASSLVHFLREAASISSSNSSTLPGLARVIRMFLLTSSSEVATRVLDEIGIQIIPMWKRRSRPLIHDAREHISGFSSPSQVSSEYILMELPLVALKERGGMLGQCAQTMIEAASAWLSSPSIASLGNDTNRQSRQAPSTGLSLAMLVGLKRDSRTGQTPLVCVSQHLPAAKAIVKWLSQYARFIEVLTTPPASTDSSAQSSIFLSHAPAYLQVLHALVTCLKSEPPNQIPARACLFLLKAGHAAARAGQGLLARLSHFEQAASSSQDRELRLQVEALIKCTLLAWRCASSCLIAGTRPELVRENFQVRHLLNSFVSTQVNT